MQNPTRTLLILLGFALAGVSALGFGAYRYAKIAEGRTLSGESALRRVDAFIEVRRGMSEEIRSWNDGMAREGALAVARDRALAAHRLDVRTYAETRRMYRAWRDGRLRAGTAMAAALERRRRELDRIDLGRYESLDS